MRRTALAAAVIACATAGLAAGCDHDDADLPDAPEAPIDAAIDAPRPAAGASRGTFELTYYWVTAEDDYPGTATEPLYTPACAVLATVTPDFARNLRLEGTGRLHDGRVVNTAGSCDCPSSPCFAPVDADHPWGIGVQDRPLVPYRSVAVDHTVVPYGTSLYVEELDGVAVPGDPPWGGFVHDGCVRAADTGGNIVGAHLDWFVGLRSSYRTLDGRLDLASITVHDGGARCP
ncbi:MAG TPA: 3D domain-containing protein [Kofleriaceae bacterium]|nr:3D domain-containing protein [Kofleriaceae bacterium]